MRNPRADDLTRSAPRVEWVSRSNSSHTRSRSASRPSGRISTSQRIAPHLAGRENVDDGVVVLVQDGLAQLLEPFVEPLQGERQGGGVLADDGRPQLPIA